MPDTLKVAVIGVGHLGQWHAEKYAAHPQCQLVAVVDSNRQVAEAIAQKYNTRACTDFRTILPEVDAVSLVVPTSLHYKIAREILKAGIHCLIEKPISETVTEASELIQIAQSKQVILQVGHIERFNSVMTGILEILKEPQFIESTRLAPFSPRATDVSVILDLMIHDIDIILDLIKKPIKHISASGLAVLSDNIDIANAHIVFENNCVANVTASRIDQKRERKLRIFHHQAYLSADFQNNCIATTHLDSPDPITGFKQVQHQQSQFEQNDALNLEVLDFINAVTTGKPPMVDGEAGKHALETAIAITALIKSST